MLSCHATHMIPQQRTQHQANDKAQKDMTVQMHAMMLLINDSLTFHVMRLFQPGQAMGRYCVCECVSSAEFGTLRAWRFLHKGKNLEVLP